MKTNYLILLLLFPLLLNAQNRIRVFGYVIDTNNRGIEFANVFIEGTMYGATTNRNGFYEINTEIADSATIVFSMLGYETIRHTIFPTQRVMQITVQLEVSDSELEDFEIVARRIQTSNIQTLEPARVRLMPSTTGGIESLFISFTGVVSTNELSSQYNVRGGNFDENLVYVNGIEIHRPFLIRSGKQEGMSFINPDMVERVNFSSGGFEARYGDRMSSVLDVSYRRPTRNEASLSLSLLGASAFVATANNNFTQMHGIRYRTTAYLLGTLDTQAEYRPNFLDYQTFLTYQINPNLELSFLGNFSQNSFRFVPQRRETRFGTHNLGRRLVVHFGGQEVSLFQTAFGSFTLNYRPAPSTRLSLLASAFNTNERETYDITGEYWLGEVRMGLNNDDEDPEVFGVGIFHEHARNRLNATVANIGHQGEHAVGRNHIRWGITGQIERINDRISEWEMRDSVGYSLPHTGDRLELFYNLQAQNRMNSWRTLGFIQNTFRTETDWGRWLLTGGVRGNYWSFNNELIVSPRASVSLVPHWERDFSFRFATGVFYQAPFYREIRRDTVDIQTGNACVFLNHNIRSQRSLHFVLGGDHYFRAWGRPFKFTTEAYLKLADRVITYSLDNVKIRYSGVNDAVAYTAGIDFRLFGELVPGTDSWINFSLMRSQERLISPPEGASPGWVSRPNEQRFAFSMLFQDYLPTNPNYRVHMKLMWSDGLPFGVPRSMEHRAIGRMGNYSRIDLGSSRVFSRGNDNFMNRPFFRHIENIWLSLEVFNLLDFKNENSIFWVADFQNQQWAVPNYLTGRQFNFRVVMDFN